MIALVVWCWKFLPCIAVVLVNHRLSGGKHADEEDGDEDHGDGHVDGEDGDQFRKIIICWAANGQLEFIF